MERVITTMLILLIIISGCQSQSPATTEISKPPKESLPKQEKQIEPKEVNLLSIKSENFERVVGWLSNKEILYVTRHGSNFSLSTHHIKTGEKKQIIKIDEPILEVRIHPDLTKLAIVTSQNSLSASIHIFSVLGDEVDELIIESSEMYWDWDSLNNEQLFFSAFYEDWTYDSFVYSSMKKEVSRLETSNPFGKWGYKSTIHTINWPPDDSLSGGALREINVDTMSFKDSLETNIIYVETFKEINLTVRISENQQFFLYTLTNRVDGKNKTYEVPAVSNYSQWFVPEVEWLDDGTMITYQAAESGLMDSIPAQYTLVQLTSADTVKQSIWKGPYESFTCSPLGSHCLIGAQLEGMLVVGSGTVKPWIEIKK